MYISHENIKSIYIYFSLQSTVHLLITLKFNLQFQNSSSLKYFCLDFKHFFVQKQVCVCQPSFSLHPIIFDAKYFLSAVEQI